MTEDEWLTCTNIDEMLVNLPSTASSRKLTLFGCACCRRLWPLLVDGSRRSVEAAEQGADGLIARGKMQAAWEEAEEALESVWRNWHNVSIELLANREAAEAARRAVEAVINSDEETFDFLFHVEFMAQFSRDALAYFAAKDLAQVIDPPQQVVEQTETFHHREDTAGSTGEYYQLLTSERILVKNQDAQIIRSAWLDEMHRQCSLFREVFGNPFQPVTVDEKWLTWSGNTVVNLAQAIYEERAFERLPILADALEEAGCTDADILNHCRQPGQHVLGCWPVDLLLGKK